MTDAELIERARSDPAAFRTLYDRYAAAIHSYHLRRTRHAEAALDLTAETFAQAWVSRLRFRDASGGSAGPWLYGIARHVLLVSVRRGRLEQRACQRLGVLEALDRPPAAVEPQERWLEGLDEAFADLPGRPARGDPAAHRGRPRLRRDRRPPLDDGGGGPRTCLARVVDAPLPAARPDGGTTMTEPLSPDLVQLGDVLEAAAERDLAAAAPAPGASTAPPPALGRHGAAAGSS